MVRGDNKPMNGRLVPTDVRAGRVNGPTPTACAGQQGLSTGAFSLIMAVQCLTDQRFHSLVRTNHSLGEMSWSLPSGYQ